MLSWSFCLVLLPVPACVMRDPALYCVCVFLSAYSHQYSAALGRADDQLCMIDEPTSSLYGGLDWCSGDFDMAPCNNNHIIARALLEKVRIT